MEILEFNEHHNQFRHRLRTFLEKEVAPCADQWDEDQAVPKSVWNKMGQEGFLCPCISKEYGGLGGDFRYALIVNEELSRTRQMQLAVTLHNDVVVPYIDVYGSKEQKRKYLPGCVSGEIITAVAMTEPDAGSDLAGLKTRATPDEDSVIINGSKTFITSGIKADLVVLAARDSNGETGHHSISLYLVESGTPGFKRGRRLDKMGWRSQDTAELFFTDCRIPVANRLGEKGAGFSILMEKLQQERLSVVLTAVFMAERILEWAIELLGKFTVKGKPLSGSQAVQFALAEMATEIRIGKTFMEKLVADHIEGMDVVVETSMAKYWITDMVNRTADRCLDLLGSHGTLERCPIVRAKRDVRVMPIFAGTNEIMKVIIAKSMEL